MTMVLNAELSAKEQEQVRLFAEFLVSRRVEEAEASVAPRHIDVKSLAGHLAGLAPEKSDVELADEAKEIIIKKYG